MSQFSWLINFLRPHRTIPVTSWTGNGRWDLSIKRVAILFFGLTIFGFGDALLVNSLTGNAPWSVLAQGISLRLGINMGTATFLISAVVLFFWWPLGEKPGFGTISNIVVIAIAIQIGVSNFPEANSFAVGILYDFLGVALVGIGSALYITCGLGPGPRDGLMTSLHNLTGVRVGRIRLAIESCAFVGGWVLGGRTGVGTAIFALFIGQSVAIGLGVVSRFTAK
jgi:uncharacterized membrane protein YczE